MQAESLRGWLSRSCYFIDVPYYDWLNRSIHHLHFLLIAFSQLYQFLDHVWHLSDIRHHRYTDLNHGQTPKKSTSLTAV